MCDRSRFKPIATRTREIGGIYYRKRLFTYGIEVQFKLNSIRIIKEELNQSKRRHGTFTIRNAHSFTPSPHFRKTMNRESQMVN